MRGIGRVSCVVLAVILVSCLAWGGESKTEAAAEPSQSPSLDALARKMKESVRFSSFRLCAEVYLHSGEAAEPLLSEEITVIVSGPRSRVEREFLSTDAAGAKERTKNTIAVFDGRGYAKLATFPDGKTPLAWKGSLNGNARDIGSLLFAGLDVEQVDAMELSPDRYLLVRNDKTGFLEVHIKDPMSITVFVDPGHDFLVKRVEYRNENGDLIRVCEVTFREQAGRWFPAEQNIESYLDGELKPDSIIRISDPEPDPDVDPSLFLLSIPPDARVMPATLSEAEIDKMRAETGLEGRPKPVKTASAPETSSPQEVSVSKSPDAEKTTTPPASADKRPRGPWSLWSVVAAVVIGLGIGLVQRRRRRR